MVDKICGSCKHKGEVLKNFDDDFDYKVDTSYFICKLIEHDKEAECVKGQKAFVVDGSGYYAALCVENDFGCNKWEAKKE